MPLKSSILLNTKRAIKESLKNMWRGKFISIATIVVIALILFILNIITAVNFAIDNIFKELSQKVDIIIYLKDESDIIEIKNLITELESFEEIKEVKYTSKEEALENILEEYTAAENPFEKYGLPNKLPASIQIITNKPESHQIITSFLQESNYSKLFLNIESNEETKEIAKTLLQISKATKKVSLGILLSFLIGGILIIINAIHLTIYNRKEEIWIMKVVGATPFSIRLPFVLEGAFYGTFAGVLSVLLIIFFLGEIGSENIGFVNYPFQIAKMGILQVLLSILLGIISSIIAIQKYFKNS